MTQLEQYIQDNRNNSLEYRFLFQFKHLNGRIPKSFVLDVNYKPFIEKYTAMGNIKEVNGNYIWINKQNENKNMKRKIIKEERLSDQFAEYKVKDEKIKVILKNQQASKLTKYVNVWKELTKKVDALKLQQTEINTFLSAAKDEVETVRDAARDAIVEIVDVNEAAMSIVVECASSTLSLAKETEQSTVTDTFIDYKNAWEELYKLVEGDNGLKDMLDKTIKANTTVQLTISQAKRSLRLKTKESINKSNKLLTEISLKIYFDKLIKYVKDSAKKLWSLISVNKKKVNNFTKMVNEL